MAYCDTFKPLQSSREAEIAARLKANESVPSWDYYPGDDLRYLLAQLQQARQERDEARQLDFGAVGAGLLLANKSEAEKQYARAEQAEAALQQAREALKDYGRHTEGWTGCAITRWNATPDGEKPACTCGLDAVLKAVR